MDGFLEMGGYAGFVWPSYIVTAVLLVVLFVTTWRGLKSSERTLETLQAARGRKRHRASGKAPVAGEQTSDA